MIPFKKLNYDEREINAVAEVMRSGMVGLGDKVFKFEKELAEYLGVKYVIATDSCTSALLICLEYEAVYSVGVPATTVPLVANAVIESGSNLYFTDDIEWIGNKYRLENTNIFDSAHEIYRYQLNDIGQREKVCYSFYPTKGIGSADGGAIATNDKDFAKWARSKITYGRNQEQKYGNSWDYDVMMFGYKRHYTNLQAAICLEQLKKLDNTNVIRERIRNKYNDALDTNNTSLYLYRINVENRDEFIEDALAEGIQCGVHYKPMYMMEAFRKFPVIGDKHEIEEDYETTVSLPFHAMLTDEDVSKVIEFTKNNYE